jgi:hypothetical protein
MRRRTLASLAVTGAALVLAGCGSGKSDQATVGAPPQSRTSTAPTAAAPPKTSPPAATAPSRSGSTTTSGGGEEPIRVPVTLVFRPDGRVSPPTVTVPAFVAIELTLASRDGRAHVLRFDDGRRAYRLAVGAGGSRATTLPGLRAGSYRLQALGGGRGAMLVVGGEAGP